MHCDGGDDVWPHSVGHADQELIGAWRSVFLDDEESCALVQDKVTVGKKTRTFKESLMHTEHSILPEKQT